MTSSRGFQALKATLLVLFIAAAAAYLWRHRDAEPPPAMPAPPAQPVSIAPTPPPGPPPGEPAGSAPVPRERVPPPLSTPPGQALGLGDPLNAAGTPEELAWLVRNGFPSAAEREAAMAQAVDPSRINLRDGASSQELLALGELARRDPTSRDQAVTQLNEAAALGSMYALEVLGNLHADPRNGNPLMSEAYFRAAEFRGNWAVAIRQRAPLDPGRDILASLMAQQFIENANRLRAQRGLPPLQHDMRPGLAVALQRMRDGVLARSSAPGGQ